VSVTVESRELVIVGGGPAGLAAALEARRAGVQTTLIEERPTLGGQIYKQSPAAFDVRRPKAFGKEYVVGRALVERALRSGAEVLAGHVVWNVWGHGPFDVAVYRPATGQAEGHARTIRTWHLVLATGAYDRPVPFPGWTLPGVLTAGGAQSMVKIQKVYPGDRILMAGSGPLILAFSVQLHQLGANVVGVLEAAPRPGPGPAVRLLRAALGGNLPLLREGIGYLGYLRRHGIPLLYGHAIARVEGADQVERAVAVQVDRDWRPIAGTERRFDVDTVCIGYGFLPSLEIPRLLGCALRYEENQGGHIPVRDADLQSSVPGLFVVGDGAGVAGSAVAVEEGRIAGIVAARRLGRLDRATADERLRRRRRRLAQLERFRVALDQTYRIGPGIYEWATDETIVCRCEEVTVGEVRRQIRPGSRDPNAVKSLTRIGMGLCQGHNCSQQVSAIFAHETGRRLVELLPLSPRPPVRPVPVGLIADTTVPEMPTHVVSLPEIEVGTESPAGAGPEAGR
jgi:NADPH-dependent 2,4-dienoyl-CoA reductase/sulfur reductase-like enzyme